MTLDEKSHIALGVGIGVAVGSLITLAINLRQSKKWSRILQIRSVEKLQTIQNGYIRLFEMMQDPCVTEDMLKQAFNEEKAFVDMVINQPLTEE